MTRKRAPRVATPRAAKPATARMRASRGATGATRGASGGNIVVEGPWRAKSGETSFLEFVLDQLKPLPQLRSRAMFGGNGIYSGPTFFAIVHRGKLYFRVDDRTRADYEGRGMKPFRPHGTQTLSYYEVPGEILEDPREVVVWARRALKRQV